MLKFVCAACLLLSASGGVSLAQKLHDPWLRVITGESYSIDVNKETLTLKEGGIVNASFRTSNDADERIEHKSGLKYRERIDSIDFRTSDRNYRVLKNTYFDTTGRIVYEYVEQNLEWKPPNSTAKRFYQAASQLAPFGSWKVLTYRYVTGEGPSDDDSVELRALIGATVGIRLNSLFIGESNCSGISFDFRSATNKDLKHYGFSLDDFGIKVESVNIMTATCSVNRNLEARTLIFLHTTSRATMLWNGVFFEIERLSSPFI